MSGTHAPSVHQYGLSNKTIRSRKKNTNRYIEKQLPHKQSKTNQYMAAVVILHQLITLFVFCMAPGKCQYPPYYKVYNTTFKYYRIQVWTTGCTECFQANGGQSLLTDIQCKHLHDDKDSINIAA